MFKTEKNFPEIGLLFFNKKQDGDPKKAIHGDPDYSAVVAILTTDSGKEQNYANVTSRDLILPLCFEKYFENNRLYDSRSSKKSFY